MTSIADYPRRYCPACDQVVRRDFRPGPGGRPDARCPKCESLERHRFFALLLAMLEPVLGEIGTLLEIAPSPQTTHQLGKLDAGLHMGLDIGYDGRLVDVLGSMTELPYADDTIDLMVCYHVLEHIPDDATAMREMARVLAPGGIALVQVPWRPGTVTDEDPSASEEERLRRFGQRDHVRYYGDDFETRMTAAGLSFDRITPRSVLGESMVTWCKLVADEPVWIVRSGTDPGTDPAQEIVLPASTSLSLALDATLGELATVREELSAARDRVRRLKERRDELDEQLRTAATPAPLTAGRVARGVVRRVRGVAGR